jgi:class 3 adenylate cyclase
VATQIKRKNEGLLRWIRSTVVTVATYGALLAMDFRPGWGAALVALIAGALTLIAPDLGVLAAVIGIGLPLLAANPVVGVLFLILGIVGIRYLGADGGQVFLIVAAAVAGAFFGPVWAAAAIAGVAMTAGEAALAAGVACVTIEAVGVLIGRASIGATITGGTKALVVFGDAMPDSFFAPTWVAVTFKDVGADQVNAVMKTLAAIQDPVFLVVQPLVWAGTAALAALVMRESRKRRSPLLGAAGVALVALVPAIGYAFFATAFAHGFNATATGIAATTSALLAAVFTIVWEQAFYLERVVAPSSGAARPASMAAEDADVDELLSLIATAEEKLTTQHTTTKVVMITDMKSFSRMTEEDGSMLTAKAIQRHRDLLLPVIEQHGGHGKSTGGDGLVAAFADAASAVLAAAEMQRVLDAHNRNHADERDMTVRIGVAEGEVVLDKGGRPFIGAALNLAARVMNLADGGQSFVTRRVWDRAVGTVPGHSHGEFDLKNIAKPVEVVELLWGEGQQPVAPRGRTDA